MIRQTRAATAQIKSLFEHYVERSRHDAAQHLLVAVSKALDQIEAAPMAGGTHPRPYPGMARWGFRWIKVHRYWFGYAIAPECPVLTNVLFDAADLPERVAGTDDEVSAPDGGNADG